MAATIACASATTIECKHVDAEIYFWVNLGPMMLPGETVIDAMPSSEDAELILGDAEIITEEQVIYKDPECLVVWTTIGADRGVFFLIGGGTVGLQTVKLTFEKSTGETDVITLLLRVVD